MYSKKSAFFKIISIFLLMFFSISFVNASCILGFQGSCPVYNSGELQVNIQGETIDESYIEVYEKLSGNSLAVENQTIKDIFKTPGVYEISALPKDKSGALNTLKTKEFIVDSAQPRPPVVNSLIYGEFEVSTQYLGDTIILRDKQGNQLERVTLDDSTSTTLSLSQSGYVTISVLRNSLESEPVERFYYSQKPSFGNELASGIQLNIQDIELINAVTPQGSTNKDLFYIGGSAQGDYLYVNGQKIIVENGIFGAFVKLNEGQNNIEVLGESSRTYSIFYEEKFVRFEELDVDKLIASSSASISGEVTSNNPLLIYVDGSFYDQITPNAQGEFEFNITDISKQKTYLQIKGYDGLSYTTFIYKDQQSPTVSFNSFSTLSPKEYISFLIKDDMGVEEESIVLTQNSKTYKYSDFTRHGDYYLFPTRLLESGQIEISLNDRVGNSVSSTHSITLDNTRPIPLNMSVSGSKFKLLGNHMIFSKLGQQELTFIMESPFAFEHIYVDGVDQTNYEIFSDNSLGLNFEIENKSGEIRFIYIDDQGRKFSRQYTYEVLDSQKLHVESLSNLHFKQRGNSLSITGFFDTSEVIDKNSIKINGVKPLWFGNNLEVHSIGDDDITISGYDLLSRAIQPSSQVSNQVDYSSSFSANKAIPGKMLTLDVRSSNPNQLYFIGSLDSQSQKNTYFKDSGMYSSAQIQGKRVVSTELFANGDSQEIFFEQILDSVEPMIFLSEQQNSNYIIVDGTFSEIEENYDVSVQTSSCSLKNSPYQKCFEVGKEVTQFQATFRDRAGNTLSGDFLIAELPLFNSTSAIEPKIYFTGNQKITSKEKAYISGHYMSQNYPLSISTSQANCTYDEQNFGCPVQIAPGENSYEIIFKFENQEIVKTWNITRPQQRVDLSLDDITGNENVYNLGGLTYYFGGNVSISGTSTLPQDSSYSSQTHPESVVLEINGRKVYKKVSGTGVLNLNLGDELSIETQDVDEKIISIQANSFDEQSGESQSNTLTLMYAKLNELLVSIIFE